jgi:hypothetical protein
MKKFTRRTSGAGYMPAPHCDQSSQYTAEEFQCSLIEHGIRFSMSRSGDRWFYIIHGAGTDHCADFTKLRNQQERERKWRSR